MVFLIPHPLLWHTHFLFNYMFYSSSHTKGSYNLGGVKCQPSLKYSGYYVAHLTPLNLADWLESFLSLLVLYFFKQFQFRRLSLDLQLTNFVDKPKFHIAK